MSADTSTDELTSSKGPGVNGTDLPSHLTLADVEAAVRDSGTLLEVSDTLRLGRKKTRRLLRELELDGEIFQAGAASLTAAGDGGRP